jgi:hypothetical protein
MALFVVCCLINRVLPFVKLFVRESGDNPTNFNSRGTFASLKPWLNPDD